MATKRKGRKSGRRTRAKNGSSAQKNAPKKAPGIFANVSEFFKGKKLLLNIIIWVVVFFVSLICVDYAVQYLNYHASAAIVDGERISRKQYIERLEKAYGKTIATQLIDEKVIRMEADRKGVSVKDKDIDEVLDDLYESAGGKKEYEKIVAESNLTMDDVRYSIETNLLARKMILEDVEFTEDQKMEVYEENKEILVPDNPEPTYEEAEDAIIDFLESSEVQLNGQAWFDEVKDKAVIQDNIEDKKGYEFLGITIDFFEKLFNKDKDE